MADLQNRLQEQARELDHYKAAYQTSDRQLTDTKTKLASLQKIMLRAGRKEEVPLDSDITGRFLTLKGDILNLVKNHFGVFIQPKGGYGKNASPDISELIVRAKFANKLYQAFFSPDVKLFGIEDDRSDNLFRWVEESVLSKRIHGGLLSRDCGE